MELNARSEQLYGLLLQQGQTWRGCRPGRTLRNNLTPVEFAAASVGFLIQWLRLFEVLDKDLHCTVHIRQLAVQLVELVVHLLRAHSLILRDALLRNQITEQRVHLHHAAEPFIFVQQVDEFGFLVRAHKLERVLVHALDLVVRQPLRHLKQEAVD